MFFNLKKFTLTCLIISGQTFFSQLKTTQYDDGTIVNDSPSFTEMAFAAKPANILSCPSASNLVTIYATNNAQRGIMFDVQGINAVTILCFEMNLNAGTTNIEIYTKTGTHVGFVSTPAAWTLIGTANNVTSAGVNLPTAIPIAVNQVIAAGATRAFYITRTTAGGPTGAYTNGTAVGTVLASDANIRILEGTGKDYPFGSSFSPRRWNGRAFYDVGVLPVEFSGFDAFYSDKTVKLKWSTASEKNNDFFSVERSVDGINFEEVKKVRGSGNSSSDISYEDMDEQPLKGLSYYRIRQTDYDGSFIYTPKKAVSPKIYASDLVASPVPASDQLKLSFSTIEAGIYKIEIYNASGKTVHLSEIKVENGFNENLIDLSAFANGIYQLNLSSTNQVHKLKFIKE